MAVQIGRKDLVQRLAEVLFRSIEPELLSLRLLAKYGSACMELFELTEKERKLLLDTIAELTFKAGEGK